MKVIHDEDAVPLDAETPAGGRDLSSGDLDPATSSSKPTKTYDIIVSDARLCSLPNVAKQTTESKEYLSAAAHKFRQRSNCIMSWKKEIVQDATIGPPLARNGHLNSILPNSPPTDITYRDAEPHVWINCGAGWRPPF